MSCGRHKKYLLLLRSGGGLACLLRWGRSESNLNDKMATLNLKVIQFGKGSLLIFLVVELNKSKSFATGITFHHDVCALNVKALEQSSEASIINREWEVGNKECISRGSTRRLVSTRGLISTGRTWLTTTRSLTTSTW